MTLTQTAILFKRSVLASVIILTVGILSFIIYQTLRAYYLAHLPPVEEKPDTKFGLLPPPKFPDAGVSTSNFSYSIDTVTGGLPETGIDSGFEKIIKVYFVTQTFATLLSSDKSTDLAQKFGLTLPPNIISETKYQFSDSNRVLFVDLDNGNFIYNKEASASATVNPDDDLKIVSDFQQALSSLGVLNEDLRVGRNKVVRTQAITVSLWPADIDKKRIFTADYNKSLVNATVLGRADNLENYLNLNFTYYPVDTSTFATYPTKTVDAAFDDLKNGKGVIIVEPEKPQVSITAVSLGYFLPEIYSPYLQPIYVFEGPDFVAYVAAIAEQFQSEAN